MQVDQINKIKPNGSPPAARILAGRACCRAQRRHGAVKGMDAVTDAVRQPFCLPDGFG
jgi:hypothetical protein